MADPPSASTLWPADNPGVIAHLNILQSIITRLANNSASCKTWCLTLVSALVSLAGAIHAPAVLTFTLLPVAIFGFMDTMYLAQEKAYRNLYDQTVSTIRSGSYSLDGAFAASAQSDSGCVAWALASWSVLPIYLGLIAAYIIAYSAGWFELLAAAGNQH